MKKQQCDITITFSAHVHYGIMNASMTKTSFLFFVLLSNIDIVTLRYFQACQLKTLHTEHSSFTTEHCVCWMVYILARVGMITKILHY